MDGAFLPTLSATLSAILDLRKSEAGAASEQGPFQDKITYCPSRHQGPMEIQGSDWTWYRLSGSSTVLQSAGAGKEKTSGRARCVGVD